MKYFDKTFWQMTALFLMIVVGTLASIYYLKEYEERQSPGAEPAVPLS